MGHPAWAAEIVIDRSRWSLVVGHWQERLFQTVEYCPRENPHPSLAKDARLGWGTRQTRFR
jgi:hypothetical protein